MALAYIWMIFLILSKPVLSLSYKGRMQSWVATSINFVKVSGLTAWVLTPKAKIPLVRNANDECNNKSKT